MTEVAYASDGEGDHAELGIQTAVSWAAEHGTQVPDRQVLLPGNIGIITVGGLMGAGGVVTPEGLFGQTGEGRRSRVGRDVQGPISLTLLREGAPPLVL